MKLLQQLLCLVPCTSYFFLFFLHAVGEDGRILLCHCSKIIWLFSKLSLSIIISLPSFKALVSSSSALPNCISLWQQKKGDCEVREWRAVYATFLFQWIGDGMCIACTSNSFINLNDFPPHPVQYNNGFYQKVGTSQKTDCESYGWIGPKIGNPVTNSQISSKFIYWWVFSVGTVQRWYSATSCSFTHPLQ